MIYNDSPTFVLPQVKFSPLILLGKDSSSGTSLLMVVFHLFVAFAPSDFIAIKLTRLDSLSDLEYSAFMSDLHPLNISQSSKPYVKEWKTSWLLTDDCCRSHSAFKIKVKQLDSLT